MHLDPIMPLLTATLLLVVILGTLLRRFNLPYVVLYLLVGILIGPFGLGLIKSSEIITHLGSIGILLLLFFIGMEISLKNIISNWKVAIFGTLLQIIISTLVIAVLGYWLQWSYARIIVIGFVLSLSSTAVVIKILQDWKESESEVGRDAISILLVQDIAIVPMMITIGLMGNDSFDTFQSILQIVGGLLFIGLMIWIFKKKKISLPFGNLLRKDHELQVFAAFSLCFGLATITGLFQLSAALGAFLAGIIVSAASETDWIHQRLEPFYVVFVAAFFVSIGMLIDLNFLQENLQIILLLTGFAFILNNLINTLVLKSLKVPWKRSIYGGALLSQIGEFSFLIAGVALQSQIIASFAYNVTISVISLSLLISPFWIMIVKRFTCKV